jgi:signal transduction histidine kinase
MGKDALVRLALEVAAILAAVLGAAAIAFFLLSRLITKGLDELAAGAVAIRGDPSRRFPASSDPDLDAVAAALNELLDLAALQERRLAEAARLEGWREVASFLAHQLKNPLAAVLLAAKNGLLALGTASADPKLRLARESLEIAQTEAERLRALLDRFRDLAPAGLGSYGGSGEAELLELLRSLAARAERAGASVSIVPPQPAAVRVVGDRNLLEQAFWNLFANSIEAGAERGSPVSIEVRVELRGALASVLVLDSNRGIDPAMIPRLGQERVSTKKTGTGLGLLLVKRILASQGGSLELFAADEEGGRGPGLAARALVPLAPSPAAAPNRRAERKAT